MQVERNVNAHPPRRYCLPTTKHAAHNLAIMPTNHCREQCNPLVGNSLPGHEWSSLCFGG